ncbi:hypothetical protein AC791_14325 [Klebsiella sp. RIT-PI-d]|uniref:hypothetical protein n=1 Tax=Klebsiella sp. RIT-PI-d TaxID=1681196 RepID=UPI0006769251|nr:hypothetical protein [Klebsiella sp. RIT-PI-d]KNC09795.1 hypothetical protein AC791_14325 [Klebsiella sp. RIT-PI-d]
MTTITTRTPPSLISMRSLTVITTDIKTTQFGDKIKNVTQNEKKPHGTFARIAHNLGKVLKFIGNISKFNIHKSAEKNITETVSESRRPGIQTPDSPINKPSSNIFTQRQSVSASPDLPKTQHNHIDENFMPKMSTIHTLSQSMPTLAGRIDQPESKMPEDREMSSSLPSVLQPSSSSDLTSPNLKSPESGVSSLLDAIVQTKLKSNADRHSSSSLNNSDSLKDEKQGLATVMEQLKSRLDKIRDAVAPDDEVEFQKPMTKIQLEILNERKKYNSEAAVKKRADMDAREEAKVAAALNAESEAKQVQPAKEFIAGLRLDKNSIPLPPPLPEPSTTIPVSMTSVKTAPLKANNSLQEHLKRSGIIGELKKRFMENSSTQNTREKLEVKPENRFSREIAWLKSQAAQEAEVRKQADAEAEAEADARVEKAIKAEAEAAELIKIKAEDEAKAKALAEAKESELIAKIPRDERNIPVPPPLPFNH